VASVGSVDDLDRGPRPGASAGIIGLAAGISGRCVEAWSALQTKDCQVVDRPRGDEVLSLARFAVRLQRLGVLGVSELRLDGAMGGLHVWCHGVDGQRRHCRVLKVPADGGE
jgi:hypothetical protein